MLAFQRSVCGIILNSSTASVINYDARVYRRKPISASTKLSAAIRKTRSERQLAKKILATKSTEPVVATESESVSTVTVTPEVQIPQAADENANEQNISRTQHLQQISKQLFGGIQGIFHSIWQMGHVSA